MNVHEKTAAAIRAWVTREIENPSPRFWSANAEQFSAMQKLILTGDETRGLPLSVVASVVREIFPEPLFNRSDEEASIQIDRVTNALCEAFRELPRLYRIVVTVPGIKAVQGFAFKVSEEISCFAAEPSGDISRVEMSYDGRSELNLEVRLRGYYGRYEKDALLDVAWSKLRQIAFFLSYSGTPTRGEETPHELAVAWLTDDRGHKFPVPMPHGLAEYCGELNYEWLRRSGGADAPGLHLSHLLAYARSFYQKDGRGDRDHERLAAAAEWLVDSSSLTNQTMAYLAACIGLESLLGEDGGDTPTARLQDRYAYTLGKTRAERKRLANDMHEVFTLRGQLVHARASRLKGKDRATLGKICFMLNRCLVAEMASYLGATP